MLAAGWACCTRWESGKLRTASGYGYPALRSPTGKRKDPGIIRGLFRAKAW